MWVVKATLTMVDSMESFTGLAQECEDDTSSMVNKTSALENAETSAVGRACAFAGIGVIDSIASADEVHKAINRWVRTEETITWEKKQYARTEADDILDSMEIEDDIEHLKALFAKLYTLWKSDAQKGFYKKKYEDAKKRIELSTKPPF